MFSRDFHLFHLELLCGLASLEIVLPELRSEAKSLKITTVTGAQHDAIICDNDDLLRRATLAATAAVNKALFIMVQPMYFGDGSQR